MGRFLRKGGEVVLLAIAPGDAPAAKSSVRILVARPIIGKQDDPVGLIDRGEAKRSDGRQIGGLSMPRFDDEPSAQKSAQQQHNDDDRNWFLTCFRLVGHRLRLSDLARIAGDDRSRRGAKTNPTTADTSRLHVINRYSDEPRLSRSLNF